MSRAPSPEVAHVRHLDHLNLTVRNLADSLDFYAELFGFSPVEDGRGDSVPWVIVRSGEAMLCLYEHPQLPEGPHYPDAPDQLGLRHFALRIDNGDAFRARLQERRVPLLFGGPVRWPHSTSYYVSDPSGHQIEVVQWDDDRIRFDA